MKKIILILLPLPLCALEFRKFGVTELGTQATSGLVGAGIGYLFLQSNLAQDNPAAAQGMNAGQTLISLSVGYTLGVLFSGKLFHGRGNPFLTLAANFIPLVGPLAAYHLSSGSYGFSEVLALFNLNAGRLTLGLPIPYRKTLPTDLPGETRYIVNLVTINF